MMTMAYNLKEHLSDYRRVKVACVKFCIKTDLHEGIYLKNLLSIIYQIENKIKQKKKKTMNLPQPTDVDSTGSNKKPNETYRVLLECREAYILVMSHWLKFYDKLPGEVKSYIQKHEMKKSSPTQQEEDNLSKYLERLNIEP